METYMQADLSQLCRVCMQAVRADVSIGIYARPTGTDHPEPSLREMLNAICSPVVFGDEDITEQDSKAPHKMPRAVCPGCKLRIEAAYQLHRQCIETDRKLWEIIAAQQELLDGRMEGELMKDPLLDSIGERKSGFSDDASDEQKSEHLNGDEDSTDVKTEELDAFDNDPELTKHKSCKDRIAKIANKTCRICLAVFRTIRDMKAHMEKVHPESLKITANKTCSICSSVFKTIQARKTHMLEAHKDSLEEIASKTCNICCSAFDSASDMKSHMLAAHEESCKKLANKTCAFCSETFKKIYEMKNHVRELHPEKVHRCCACNAEFIDQKLYETHMLIHTTGRSHVCDICSRRFSSHSGLRYHKASHSGDKPFTCTECGRAFPNKSAFTMHMRRHRGERKFACDQCPATFYSKAGVRNHMVTHTKVKEHTCDVCGSGFTMLTSLTNHVRTVHAAERPFKCGTCGLAFTRKAHIQRHMLVHTGEKPYKCAYCDRAYAQSNDLVKHSKVHVGANPYACDRCDATFRLMTELRNHYKVHFQQSCPGGQADGGAGSESVPLRYDCRFTSVDTLKRRFQKEQQMAESARKDGDE